MKNQVLLFSRLITFLAMIITLIFHVLTFNSNTIISFIFIILFMINSLIRFNYLKDKKILFLFSLILELPLICLIYWNIFGLYFLFVLSLILDISFLNNKVFNIVLSFIVLISSLLFIYKGFNPYLSLSINLIINSICICIFFLGSHILKDQLLRKNEAQILYDKLRISEEKLQVAYSDLSSYNDSLEELTLLRERARISRELHDSVGHSLSTLVIQLSAVKSLCSSNPSLCEEMLDGLIDFSKTALENTRRAVRELKPSELEKYGFILSITQLTKKFEELTNISVKLLFSKESWNVDSDQGHQIYRIIQEALNNSVRHGKSTEINITLNFSKNNLFISIKDNGIGTDDLTPSFGMKSMMDRIQTLNGTIDFESSSGSGFSIYINIPKEGNNLYD